MRDLANHRQGAFITSVLAGRQQWHAPPRGGDGRHREQRNAERCRGGGAQADLAPSAFGPGDRATGLKVSLIAPGPRRPGSRPRASFRLAPGVLMADAPMPSSRWPAPTLGRRGRDGQPAALDHRMRATPPRCRRSRPPSSAQQAARVRRRRLFFGAVPDEHAPGSNRATPGACSRHRQQHQLLLVRVPGCIGNTTGQADISRISAWRTHVGGDGCRHA